jgi:hypothetical protein
MLAKTKETEYFERKLSIRLKYKDIGKMIMNKEKQAGFGVVIVIMVILVLAGLGYVGYRLYNHSSNSTSTTSGQTSNQTSNTNGNGAVSQATYLDIKELGVKIKLSDGIKDAEYSILSSADGPYASVSTKSLITLSNGTCGTDFGPLGTVGKASGTLQQIFGDTGKTVDSSTIFKFGTDTYVFIGSPQSVCSEDSNTQNLANQQRATFREDFKTVQLDN